MKKIIAARMFGNQNESFTSFNKESVKALVNDGFVAEAITTETRHLCRCYLVLNKPLLILRQMPNF